MIENQSTYLSAISNKARNAEPKITTTQIVSTSYNRTTLGTGVEKTPNVVSGRSSSSARKRLAETETENGRRPQSSKANKRNEKQDILTVKRDSQHSFLLHPL